MKKIFSTNRKVRLMVFLLMVVAGALAIIYSLYSDASHNRVQCGTTQGMTSNLVLRSIDPAQDQMKSGLSIPSFNPKEDSLEVSTVTGRTSGTRDYDSVFRILTPPTGAQDPNVSNSLNLPWKISLWYSSHSFFYPYETYLMNVQIDLKKNGKAVPLNLTAINRVDQATIAKCTPGYSFDTATLDPNSFTVVLRRHLFIRLTAIILYAAAVLFLVYIAKREKSDQVFASSLGYVVALWGIRSIIVGPTSPFPTIIDFFTVLLYLAVVAILIHSWLIGVDPPEESGARPETKSPL